MQNEISSLLKAAFYFILGTFSGALLTLFLCVTIPVLATKF